MPLEEHQTIQQQRFDRTREQLRPLLKKLEDNPSLHFTLEIGSGHGHYLTDYAAHHPQHLCIGIDLLADRLQRAQKKSTAAELKNLHWIQAEAMLFLNTLPDTPLIHETIILFPDPWPKRRHWKNRLIQNEFLSLLAKKMQPGGQLYFRTDHKPYFEHAKEVIKAHPAWDILPDTPWKHELETVFQSRAHSHHSLVAKHQS